MNLSRCQNGVKSSNSAPDQELLSLISQPPSRSHPCRLSWPLNSRQHESPLLSKPQPILYRRSRTVKTSFWDPLKSTLASLSQWRATRHISHNFRASTHATVNFLLWLAIEPLATSANLNLDYQDTIGGDVCQVLAESVCREPLQRP